jgi:amino acid transporter
MDVPADARAQTQALEAFGYKQELKRSLKPLDLFAYGLVMISPIAPIAVFGFVFNASRGMVPLTYALGLVAMLFTAWSYVTMARTFPIAGSVYAYANRTMGEAAGFIAGWAILLDYLLVPSLMYLLSAVALSAAVPIVPRWVWLGVLLVVNGAANLFGVEGTTKVSMVMLACDLIFLVFFMALCLGGVVHGVNGAHVTLLPLVNPATLSAATIFGALGIAALSFLGFDAISTLAEEAEGGGRAVGKATMLALTVAALLFIAQTYMLSLFLPGITSLAPGDATDQASYNIAGNLDGVWLKALVSVVGGALANAPSALTAQAATSRLLFGMARDRKLPKFLAHVSDKRRVPDRAILLVGAITIVLMAVFGDKIDTLASMVNFGALTGFLFVHLSVIAHFMVREKSRAFGRYLIAPLIGLAILSYVLWNMEPLAQIAGVTWLAIGIAAFIGMRLMRRDALSA